VNHHNKEKILHPLEGVPIGGKFPNCQNKHRQWRPREPSNHFKNVGQFWTS